MSTGPATPTHANTYHYTHPKQHCANTLLSAWQVSRSLGKGLKGRRQRLGSAGQASNDDMMKMATTRTRKALSTANNTTRRGHAQ
eukprot:566209-Amphidinium_carterae.1